ncbi:acetate--CoA ligase [Aquimarina sp. 2201CG14-23]|uniref:acetate--CoA ligase n=1 Tax=Aquimarina mycalae TaxID=3040073 RepID=UPI00247801A0|nr:acetate--CoA ligase [Aquimarina sp. 2201CG14-23]MDH7444525.1 acetate--CoA ligase [Aquimarina sp. 2201CG14-23]
METFVKHKLKRISSFDEYKKSYQRSITDPESFWSEIAETFNWHQTWDKVLEYDWTIPKTKWFTNAKLNITENCLDRHLAQNGDQTAIIWEPNDPDKSSEKYTYRELHAMVCQFANVLKSKGIKKGDRVCIYMPMVIELTVAMLACARIGAVHSVVFAGFSSEALATRINDAACTMLITADGSYRGTKNIALKNIVDEALLKCPCVLSTIILKNTGQDVDWIPGRDSWWHLEIKGVSEYCEAELMDAEDPLFILYTSGSTGKPKGMVHTIAGYMVYTSYSFLNVFQYEQNNIYWCTADIGWITGHSYIVYGPLSVGATSIVFEGIPNYPGYDRFWQVCEKHKVSHFYTAPTAIRALKKHPSSLVEKYDLSNLQVLGTVGEPINLEAWEWYNDIVGNNNCPIVDTWWQTETGGIMISSLAGVTPQKATFATLPLPGIQPALLTPEGIEIQEKEAEGILAIKFPWPGIARTIYGDQDRYKDVYFSAYPEYYFPGDGALRDQQGNYRITGRVDDVIIVSGHNLGTAPIENAINQHPLVVESALVSYPHEIKGNALYAYVITYNKDEKEEKLHTEIKETVSRLVGPIAKPDKIQIVTGLPKTRSGKIMRRILRKIATDDIKTIGDTSTLLNPDVVDEIIKNKK